MNDLMMEKPITSTAESSLEENKKDELETEKYCKLDTNETDADLKKSLFQKAHYLATEKSFSVFIKLIDSHGNSEYYGTKDLVQQYHFEGLKVRDADVELNRLIGLPEEVNVKATEDKMYDDNDDEQNEDCHDVEDNDDDNNGYKPEGGSKHNAEDASPDHTSISDQSKETKNTEEENKNVIVDKSEDTTDLNQSQHNDDKNDKPSDNKMITEHKREGSTLKRQNKTRLPPKKRQLKISSDKTKSSPKKANKTAKKTNGINNYACQQCEKKFPDKWHLERHKNVHARKTATGYKKKALLVKEKKPETRKRFRVASIKCQHCEKLFRDKWHLERHERSHTGEKPYICDECGKMFSSQSHYREHKIRHNGKKEFICDKCGRGFNFAPDLRDHEDRVHIAGKCHACQFCKMAFTQDIQLKFHEETHIEENQKDHVCSCGSKFMYPETYASHNRKVHGALLFICAICNTGLQTSPGLKGHLKSHEAPDEKFHCDQCGKIYQSLLGLKWHQAVHKEKTICCEQCDCKFYRKIDLKRHSMVHVKERNCVCETCGILFKRLSSLVFHRKKHLGEAKRYLCELCNKDFNSTAALKRHAVIHTGEKPFICDQCNKTFSRKDNLKTHMKVHSGSSSTSSHVAVKPQNLEMKKQNLESSDGSFEFSGESIGDFGSDTTTEYIDKQPSVSTENATYHHSYARPIAEYIEAGNHSDESAIAISAAVQTLKTIQWSHTY
ncbi:uncharacterized protein LOC102808155 [Saccoglossus kowalevskii]